jgi:hypothetical protein
LFGGTILNTVRLNDPAKNESCPIKAFIGSTALLSIDQEKQQEYSPYWECRKKTKGIMILHLAVTLSIVSLLDTL